MDLDRSLLWALLVSREHYDRIVGAGILQADCDDRGARKAFGFIADHLKQHDSLPTAQAVADLCGVVPEDPGVDPGYVLAEVQRRKLFRAVRDGIEQAHGALKGNDPEMAMRNLQGLVDGVKVAEARPPTTLFAQGDAVLSLYERTVRGEIGLPFPWVGMTRMTQGMWPGTLSLFVARPGVGKSVCVVLIALHVWEKANRRILIVSPEMNKASLAERFYGFAARASLTGMIRGNLTAFEEQRLRAKVDELRDKDGIWIMDATDDITPRGIDAMIRTVKPDLVAVDSLYSIRTSGSRFDRTEAALDWLNTSNKKYGYAAVAFSQQNRTKELSGKLGGGARLGTIAFSDQMGMDAHAVFSLEQTEDDKLDRRMQFLPLKIRRGYSEGPVVCHWDFACCNFEEIVKDRSDAYEDSSFQPGPVPTAAAPENAELPF